MRNFAFVAAATFLISSNAMAQDINFIPIVQSTTSTDMILNSNKEAWAADECITNKWAVDCNSGGKSQQKRPAANPESLKFNPSSQVRTANLNKLVNQTRKSDPATASQMEQLFASGDLIDQLDQMMRPMGLRADNLADVYALWWVAAWHAANKQPLQPNNRILAAVKQQASNALLGTPAMGSASNSAKQELAESLLIQTALIDGHIDAAAGNASQQDALAKAVNQGAKKMGLDLTTMDLTENGFVPRSGGRSDASDAVDGADPAAAPTDVAASDSAGESDTGKLALYGVGGVALLAGMFALGKSFGGKG